MAYAAIPCCIDENLLESVTRRTHINPQRNTSSLQCLWDDPSGVYFIIKSGRNQNLICLRNIILLPVIEL